MPSSSVCGGLSRAKKGVSWSWSRPGLNTDWMARRGLRRGRFGFLASGFHCGLRDTHRHNREPREETETEKHRFNPVCQAGTNRPRYRSEVLPGTGALAFPVLASVDV